MQIFSLDENSFINVNEIQSCTYSKQLDDTWKLTIAFKASENYLVVINENFDVIKKLYENLFALCATSKWTPTNDRT